MPLLILLLALPIVFIALTPLLLVQRYRVGTARRQARPWLATFGLVMMVVSAIFFLAGAAVTAFWVQDAFLGASVGIGVGVLLGAAGLVLTRWEATHLSLHYTPNRWLVLAVTLVVSARLLYGFYHSAMAVRAGITGAGVVDAFGIPQSLGAGGIVIGYYLAYSLGVRWRTRKWQQRPLRRMPS